MSFHNWSKYDLASSKHHRQTDHWSKLRCKSFKLCTLPTGQTFTFCNSNPEEKSVAKMRGRKDSVEVHQKILRVPSTLATVGNSQFNKYLVNYLLLEPNSPQTLRLYEDNEITPSTYSQRARLGYKYWLDDPYPYNSNPGKSVTLGSRGTFLGIGVPRL